MGQMWIYRQMDLGDLSPGVILCQKLENQQYYPFEGAIVEASESSYYIRALKSKLWKVFTHQKPYLEQRAARAFRAAIQEYQISLVHAHFGTMGTKVLDLCRETGTELIVTFHAFDVTSVPRRWVGYREKLQMLFAYCRKVIAISAFIREKLIALGCPEEKIILSYLGVPTERFPFIDRSDRAGKPLRFLHLGRITEKKGVPDLIRTFQQAFPQSANVELEIVGSGEEEEYCQQLLKELSLANPVKILPAVAADEVLSRLHQADVFVLNSRTDSANTTEGLPIAVLEAASTGLPVISTYHAGIPESVMDGATGLLVPEYDHVGLANAMRKMQDEAMRLTMGKQARKLMEDKFDLRGCNQMLYNTYRMLLSVGEEGVLNEAER